MKVKVIIIATIIIIIFNSGLFSKKDPNTLIFKDIQFKPIEPEFEQIKKGISMYYVEDRETPTISVYFILKAGEFNDPIEKTGLTNITAKLLKSGGTASFTPEEIEEKLDFLGSNFLIMTDNEHTILGFWTLKKNFDASWNIFTEMIFKPRFDEKRLNIEKMKEMESIRRRWDQPINTGFILFSELLYGKGYPEIRRTTSKSIESINKTDIETYYKTVLKDREFIIALCGDFEKQKIVNRIQETFSNWKGKPALSPKIPKAKLAAAPGIYFIDKEDMTQAVVCVGHLGINRLDPDNVEMNVLNYIYGSGGFNSRIMREIRSNRGLAYSAFGNVGNGRDKGIFFNFCMTKNESVKEAISIIENTMESITTEAVTPEELQLAKNSEKNSFVHRFDSSFSILAQKIINKLNGYPDNYLETYLARIEKVDAPKVLEMAVRTINPKQSVILIVGKKTELFDQLNELKLGKINEIKLAKE